MGSSALLAGVLCWTLPETKSVPTAEVMSPSEASPDNIREQTEKDESKL